jgi:hypothetical protein
MLMILVNSAAVQETTRRRRRLYRKRILRRPTWNRPNRLEQKHPHLRLKIARLFVNGRWKY